MYTITAKFTFWVTQPVYFLYTTWIAKIHGGKETLSHWFYRKVQDQIRSVAQSCLILCDPMDCSTPGLRVHRQLPAFTQTHVDWAGDAIQEHRFGLVIGACHEGIGSGEGQTLTRQCPPAMPHRNNRQAAWWRLKESMVGRMQPNSGDQMILPPLCCGCSFISASLAPPSWFSCSDHSSGSLAVSYFVFWSVILFGGANF